MTSRNVSRILVTRGVVIKTPPCVSTRSALSQYYQLRAPKPTICTYAGEPDTLGENECLSGQP